MELYFAPMEGITGYIFRNAYNEYFGEGVNKYFTPFITPCEKRAVSGRELNDVAPKNNTGLNIVPQVITAKASDFNMVKERLRDIGYTEVNLNLGCPSRTVTSKGRGSGALVDLSSLDRLLEGIFADGDNEISIKTRIGVVDAEEFHKIMDIYVKYPIKELTIHPRVTNEMYKGKPHVDIFMQEIERCPFKVCYNGDICSVKDYENIINMTKADNLHAIMIGRGALMRPVIFNEIAEHIGGQKAKKTSCSMEQNALPDSVNDRILDMMLKLRKDYSEIFSGQRPVLYKLKEIWSYLRVNFEDDKLIKKLLKSNSIEEFEVLERLILQDK